MASALFDACAKSDLEEVRRIVRSRPDLLHVHSTNHFGGTPLRHACWFGALNIVKYLVEVEECGLSARNVYGSTPLHYACLRGYLEIAQYIVQQDASTTTIKNGYGATPLHHACVMGRLEVVKFLIEVAKCDLHCEDHDGKSPLHMACRYGRTDAVSYLLKEVQLNPDCATKSGETPLSYARKPAIIRELLQHGATPDYRLCSKHLPSNCPKQPAPQAVKTFVVGDSGAGKSTLTKSLQKESNVLSYVANRVSKVSGVDQKTAGIVPHDIESRKFGRLTLYDFAGQKEFYAGHDAILRSAVSGSPAAVFLIVADLCSSDEEFKERIEYWLAFLENQRLSADHKPHVIVVCSHADQLKKAVVDKKRSIIDSLTQSPAFSSFHYVGFVPMDCRYSESTSMSLLRQYLAKSCEELRSTVEMSFRSHCFLVYLLDKFRGCPAVELSKIASTVVSETANEQLTAFIPDNISGISHICDELNERGNILFLKGSEASQSSWIILDREILLSRVTGTVFAPKDFKQYCNLASSTGVVPFSKIPTHFSDLDSNMIVHFLCHLEFCHNIADSEVLQLLRSLGNSEPVATFDPTEKFFFFPHLVSIEVPSGVWESSPQFGYHCGWVLQCKPGQFFTPRFLQVLLLRLAFSYALAPDVQQPMSSDLPTLKRKCKVWKSGIYWGNRSGVEALVEVGEGSRRVVLMLRCPKGRQVECAHLRSAIIGKVLQVRNEFCQKVTISEFLLRPSDSKDYPLKPSSELTFVTTAELAKAIVKAEPGVLDVDGNGIDFVDLLGFEPYAYIGERIIHELFDEQNPSYSGQLSDEFLYSIANKNYHTFDHVNKMLDLPAASVEVHISQAAIPGEAHKMAHLLLCWRERSEGSRQCLRQRLDQFSVFAGRNPIDFDNSKASTTFTPLQPTLTHERVHVEGTTQGDTHDDVSHLSLQQPVTQEREQRRAQVGGATLLTKDDISYHSPLQPTLTVERVHAEGATQGDTHDVFHLSLQQPVTQERVQRRAQVGEETLLTKDDISHHCKPTMPELLNFTFAGKKVSIATEIGTKYVRFGTILLQDTTGSRVKNMAHRYLNDPERINTEILWEWLTGIGKLPVSWASLVEVLHDIGLSTLAESISIARCQPSNMK